MKIQSTNSATMGYVKTLKNEEDKKNGKPRFEVRNEGATYVNMS